MPASEPLRFTIEEQLCFALYTASRAMTGCYRPLLDEIGLTYPQYLVMIVLWEEGDTTVGGLGKALHLETGTLSPLLKRLESTGMIWRRRRPDDERSVLVGLTATGADLRDQAVTAQRRVGEVAGLCLDEIVEMRDKLHDLANRLRNVDPVVTRA